MPWDELTCLNTFSDDVTMFCSFAHLVAKKVASTKVNCTIFINDARALHTFTTPRSPENEDYVRPFGVGCDAVSYLLKALDDVVHRLVRFVLDKLCGQLLQQGVHPVLCKEALCASQFSCLFIAHGAMGG